MKYGNIKRAASVALFIVMTVGLGPVFSSLLSSCSKTDKDAEDVAETEAAIIDGREAARIFVQRNWKDTTELQGLLLEARSRQSKYRMAGKEQSALAFDSAFVSTLRTVRPDVARELDKNPARDFSKKQDK